MVLAIQSPLVAEGGFSERLKALREVKGLSQRQLAKKAGMDPGYIGLLETADGPEPRSRTKKRLADALGVPPGDLEQPRNKNDWKAEFLADPRYSAEVKRVLISLVEQEEKKNIQHRRK